MNLGCRKEWVRIGDKPLAREEEVKIAEEILSLLMRVRLEHATLDVCSVEYFSPCNLLS